MLVGECYHGFIEHPQIIKWGGLDALTLVMDYLGRRVVNHFVARLVDTIAIVQIFPEKKEVLVHVAYFLNYPPGYTHT